MKATLRRRLLGVAAVVLFVAAFVLATPASATHGQPGKQLPAWGAVAGTVTSVDYAPGFPFVRSTFGGRCSVPSDWVTSHTFTGEVSHGGLSTGVGSHCGRLDYATGAIIDADEVIMMTAANGDTLNSRGNGYTFPDGTTTGELTIVGGTGRFAGATGESTSSGRADLTATPWTYTLSFSGWIAYDASQASS